MMAALHLEPAGAVEPTVLCAWCRQPFVATSKGRRYCRLPCRVIGEEEQREAGHRKTARRVRPQTINKRDLARERHRLRVVYPRPLTRGQCAEGLRPCPYVGCRHHLYLDVNSHGSIKLNFPDLEPHELTESCSLDVADEGSRPLEDVAPYLNVTRERVRQIEVDALAKLEPSDMLQEIAVEEGFGASWTPRTWETEPDDDEG